MSVGYRRIPHAIRPRSVLAFILCASIGILNGPSQSEAQSLTSGSAPLITPFNNLTAQMAPNFNIAQAGAFGNLYSGCSTFSGSLDPLANTLSTALTGTGGTAAGGCTPGCVGSVPSVPACTNNEDGSFDSTAFDALINQAKVSNCCINQTVSALNSATKQLSCLDSGNQALAAQIKSLQATFQTQLNTASADVGQIDGVVNDRVNQTNFVETKLNGDSGNPNNPAAGPGSGNIGLLALQKQLRDVTNTQLPADTTQVENSVTQYNEQVQLFAQRVQDQKMALASQCFTSPNQGYICALNSTTPCSFEQLLEAKYYQLLRTVNGQILYNNQSNQAQAQSQKAALDALFQQIFADISQNAQLTPPGTTDPSQQNSLFQQLSTTNTIQTPQDLDRLFGAQLASFDISGLNIHDLFEAKFEQCYQQATATITQSESQPTSQYSLSEVALQAQQKTIRDNFTLYYRKYGDLYTQFWSVMGQTAPLDTSACEAASTPIAGMLQCAEDLKTNLNGVFTGNTPNSMVSVTVTGATANPPTTFSFNCYGVNGCVTTLQNVDSNLKTETQRLDKVKSDFITQTNANIDQFKNQIDTTLNVQSQALQNQLTQLKSTLAQNGVTDPITITPLQPYTWTKTPTKNSTGQTYDGLYAMPTNFLAAIGGDLSPPLPDPTNDSFGTARAAIAGTLNTDRQQATQIQAILAQMPAKELSCETQAEKGLTQGIQQNISGLANCSRNSQWCSNAQDGPEQIGNLMSSAAQLTGNFSSNDSSSIQTALNGILNDCSNNNNTLSNAQTVHDKCIANANLITDPAQLAVKMQTINGCDSALQTATQSNQNTYGSVAGCDAIAQQVNSAIQNAADAATTTDSDSAN